MSSRREVRWGETGDHDHQGRSAYGKDEASQYTRDEVMFPEIVECAKGVEILEGAQRGANVGETRYRVVSANSSSGSIQSSGRKKSKGRSHSIQDQQGFKLSSHSETPGVALKRQIVCHRCGQLGHIRSQCQEPRGRSCFTCGEFDHVARNCPLRKRMQEGLGLVQQPGVRQIVIQPPSQNAQKQSTIRMSMSPGNFRSQERKRSREPNQPSQNQINLGPPTLSGHQGVSQLDRLCYVCRKPSHFARNCPRGSEVHGELSSVQQHKRTLKQQQMQFRS